MKKSLLVLTATALAFAASSAPAQTVVRETTTAVEPVEIAGTVTEYAPDAIVIRTQEAAAPVRYTFSKTTQYVDETGAPVTLDVVKSGAPVTIRYIREGDRMIANRVIVRRQTTTTAPTGVTTTTTAPVAPAVTTKKTTTTTTSE